MEDKMPSAYKEVYFYMLRADFIYGKI